MDWLSTSMLASCGIGLAVVAFKTFFATLEIPKALPFLSSLGTMAAAHGLFLGQLALARWIHATDSRLGKGSAMALVQLSHPGQRRPWLQSPRSLAFLPPLALGATALFFRGMDTLASLMSATACFFTFFEAFCLGFILKKG